MVNTGQETIVEQGTQNTDELANAFIGADLENVDAQSDFEDIQLDDDPDQLDFLKKEEQENTDSKEENSNNDNNPDDKLNFDDKDDENKDDDISVDALNKMFGTDYKTKEEFKELLGKSDSDESNEINEEEVNKARGLMDYYESLEKLPDYQLLYNNEVLKAKQEAKRNGEEVDEESLKQDIEDMLENWKSSGSIGPNASLLRKQIEDAKNTPLSVLNKVKEKEQEQIAKRTESIQEELGKIYTSGNFFGIKPTKEDVKKVYKSVVNNDFVESLKKDTNLAVKVGLFVQFMEQIEKRATGPTKSDGVKEILDELSGANKGSSQTLSNVASSNSKGVIMDSDDIVSSWLK